MEKNLPEILVMVCGEETEERALGDGGIAHLLSIPYFHEKLVHKKSAGVAPKYYLDIPTMLELETANSIISLVANGFCNFPNGRKVVAFHSALVEMEIKLLFHHPYIDGVNLAQDRKTLATMCEILGDCETPLVVICGETIENISKMKETSLWNDLLSKDVLLLRNECNDDIRIYMDREDGQTMQGERMAIRAQDSSIPKRKDGWKREWTLRGGMFTVDALYNACELISASYCCHFNSEEMNKKPGNIELVLNVRQGAAIMRKHPQLNIRMANTDDYDAVAVSTRIAGEALSALNLLAVTEDCVMERTNGKRTAVLSVSSPSHAVLAKMVHGVYEYYQQYCGAGCVLDNDIDIMWDIRQNIFFVNNQIACIYKVLELMSSPVQSADVYRHTMPIFLVEEEYTLDTIMD